MPEKMDRLGANYGWNDAVCAPRRLPLRGAPNKIPSQHTATRVITIRVKRNTNRITSHLAVLPRAISIIRKIRVKRNTNRIASYLEVLPRAISKIRKIRV